ncbi:MAG TPA: mandelate racemase/muconate lactonizing enzyme family protein [Polyangiaceae bacterium]|nr:mandelate racemase/muconate lactonizing enzyme family protein [Polyangiaceae bacterium]
MKLELRRVSVPSSGALDARRTLARRESLLLRLTDRDGELGLGEASPLPQYSRDELDDIEPALSAIPMDALEAALEQVPARAALRAVSSLVSFELPSARMALETAALDLLGNKQGISSPLLLGGQADAQRPISLLLGPVLDHTRRGGTIDGAATKLITATMASGFRHFKLKLGAKDALARELATLAAVRQRFGSSISLRLDANGLLSAADITSAWEALEPLDIELFEEPGPVPETLIGRLPLGLDESLQGLSEDDVEAAIRKLKPRALVLKPTALGGIDHCFRLAERARGHGVDVIISHCFDGPLAFRACAALALALPRGLAHGLGPHSVLSAWNVKNPAPKDATLQAWREPGLGNLGSPW